MKYDLAIVGGGIVGLATAKAGLDRGLSVALFERNAHCVGASIRNFGFVTVSGQRAGAHWARAMKSRNVWADVVKQAEIEVLHRGLFMPAQTDAALAVAEAFLATEMGADCRMLGSKEVSELLPFLANGDEKKKAVMYSPHELRVESKTAIGQLSRWLQSRGLHCFYETAVSKITQHRLQAGGDEVEFEHCVVCPGNDLSSLFPEVLQNAGIRQCSLNMLRVMPQPFFRLPGAIMSDLSFARYEGFASLVEGQALKKALNETHSEYLKRGIHLIVVQSSDGSLVIGDSHSYGDTEHCFRDEENDRLILQELERLIPEHCFSVMERWSGTYASADDVVFSAKMMPGVVVGVVTGGTGASTGFAFGEELVEQVLDN